jgi:transcriptional regulator with XRE-family HTH domain
MSAAALEAGLSKSLVTKWKQNKVEVPSAEALKKLSEYFKIPVSELLEEKEIPAIEDSGYSEEELMLLEWFRKDASPTQKAMIRLMFEDVDRT